MRNEARLADDCSSSSSCMLCFASESSEYIRISLAALGNQGSKVRRGRRPIRGNRTTPPLACRRLWRHPDGGAAAGQCCKWLIALSVVVGMYVCMYGLYIHTYIHIYIDRYTHTNR
jgi:hypothetical protein